MGSGDSAAEAKAQQAVADAETKKQQISAAARANAAQVQSEAAHRLTGPQIVQAKELEAKTAEVVAKRAEVNGLAMEKQSKVRLQMKQHQGKVLIKKVEHAAVAQTPGMGNK